MTSVPTRFVALDIHRKYLVVGAVDSQQQIILTPRRFGGLCLRRVGQKPLNPL
jgi:hypothetical protein